LGTKLSAFEGAKNMDIYQGSMSTVSPAIGSYELQTYINIDKVTAGMTGYGVTGAGTLEPVLWDVGVTGIVGANFTNAKHGF
jgi:hypothetical protein